MDEKYVATGQTARAIANATSLMRTPLHDITTLKEQGSMIKTHACSKDSAFFATTLCALMLPSCDYTLYLHAFIETPRVQMTGRDRGLSSVREHPEERNGLGAHPQTSGWHLNSFERDLLIFSTTLK